jgi:hypothetical protein
VLGCTALVIPPRAPPGAMHAIHVPGPHLPDGVPPLKSGQEASEDGQTRWPFCAMAECNPCATRLTKCACAAKVRNLWGLATLSVQSYHLAHSGAFRIPRKDSGFRESHPLEPRFKGVWYAAVNFAPLLLPDTMPDQCPQPYRRSDDGPGHHGPGGISYHPQRSARASLA